MSTQFFTFEKIPRAEIGNRKARCCSWGKIVLYRYTVNNKKAFDFFWMLRARNIPFFSMGMHEKEHR